MGDRPWSHKESHTTEWIRDTYHHQILTIRVCRVWRYPQFIYQHYADTFNVLVLTHHKEILLFVIIWMNLKLINSVQFSHSILSDSLRPHESQHARASCQSPTHGLYSNSCPSSRWCHPAISSSAVSFSSCPQSLPASGLFQLINTAWRSLSIGVSASASVFLMNTQDWAPLRWTGWISLQSKGISGVQKHKFFGSQLSSQSKSHIYA